MLMVKEGEFFNSCVIWYFHRPNCQSKEKKKSKEMQAESGSGDSCRLKRRKCVVCSDLILYVFNLNLDDGDVPVRTVRQPGALSIELD